MKTLMLAGSAAERTDDSLLFIGNATVLLRCGGFTLLTDPNFLHRGERASLAFGLLHATRLTEPAMDLEDLPRIDLVVLSHHHEDHFDKRVAEQLDRGTPIATTPQAARVLGRRGFYAVQPLETWDSLEVVRGEDRLCVTALPGRHGPGPLSAVLPQVMGSLLEFADAAGGPPMRLYVSGDTLVHRGLEEIPRRFPDIDLGLLHLGGTRVLGLLVTMDGRQGARALEIVRPRLAVPIHFDDYDRFRSPLADFKRAVARAGLADRVRYLRRGESARFGVRAPAQSGLPSTAQEPHQPAP